MKTFNLSKDDKSCFNKSFIEPFELDVLTEIAEEEEELCPQSPLLEAQGFELRDAKSADEKSFVSHTPWYVS